MEELWRIVADVPSHKILYPEAEFKVRPYNFGEMKVISQMRNLREIFDVISKGISSNIPIKDLTLPDFFFLALSRKLNTVGNEKVRVKTTCPRCKSEVFVIIGTESISFKDLEVKDYPIYIEVEGKRVEFMPLTVGDFLSIPDDERKDPIALLAKECKSMEFLEAKKFISEADLELGEVLTEIDKMMFHGIEPITVTCDRCGESYKRDLQGGDVVLKPFRDSSESPRYAIRFGSK